MDKKETEEGAAPEAVEAGEVSDDVLGVVSGGTSAKEATAMINLSFN